jgi:hypothetical protein
MPHRSLATPATKKISPANENSPELAPQIVWCRFKAESFSDCVTASTTYATQASSREESFALNAER